MRSLIRSLQGLWGAIALYLPLLIMGTLALATYWLYRNTPLAAPAQPTRAERHEADYFMKEFALRTFSPQGTLKSEVRGQVMHHYPDTDTVEIEQVRMLSYDDNRQLTLATASKAISNADGSEVQLLGHAQIVREAWVNPQGAPMPRMAFEGEFLHVFVNTERVKSHKPVLLTRGTDRIEAATLDFSYLDRAASFDGRVSATLGGKAAKP